MDWLNNHAEAIGILVGSIAAAITLLALTFNTFRYIQVRRSAQKQQEFENYHRIIRWLVEGYPDSKTVWLDSQIALVFELRHLRKYQEVSVRILQGLRNKWEKDLQTIKDDEERKRKERILKEIDITLSKLT